MGSSASDEVPSPRLPISAPCSGPFCRSAPAQPAPAAPVTVSSTNDRLAVNGDFRMTLFDGWTFFSGDDSDSRPTPGFPQRIDHPPRG
jgi:hypothetical protein